MTGVNCQPVSRSPARHSPALFCSRNMFLGCYCRGWMMILLKAMGRVSSRDQNPALFLLQAKWEIILFLFFFIFLKVLEPALYGFPPYFLLFLFEHLSEVVYYILICSELFFFFCAWLSVITVFHFIFINLLHLFAFDLLLVLYSICVCERASTRVCMQTGKISAFISFQTLRALSW